MMRISPILVRETTISFLFHENVALAKECLKQLNSGFFISWLCALYQIHCMLQYMPCLGIEINSMRIPDYGAIHILDIRHALMGIIVSLQRIILLFFGKTCQKSAHKPAYHFFSTRSCFSGGLIESIQINVIRFRNADGKACLFHAKNPPIISSIEDSAV